MEKRNIAVVTGATSGLGQAAALALTRLGWHVVLVGRDAERGRETLAQVAMPGSAELERADLFSIADVAALGDRLAQKHPRIDLVINNAGGTFSRTEKTTDGLERTFALNVAAPFVLTERLMPSLARAKGRVVNIVTGVPPKSRTTIAQLAGPDAEAGMGSYVRAKLALIALTREQQERHGARGVTFVALHPGIIPGTSFGQEMPAFIRRLGPPLARLFGFGSTLETAAGRYVSVGTGSVEPAGFYWEGTLRGAPAQTGDASFRAELWSRLTALVPPPAAVAVAPPS